MTDDQITHLAYQCQTCNRWAINPVDDPTTVARECRYCIVTALEELDDRATVDPPTAADD